MAIGNIYQDSKHNFLPNGKILFYILKITYAYFMKRYDGFCSSNITHTHEKKATVYFDDIFNAPS